MKPQEVLARAIRLCQRINPLHEVSPRMVIFIPMLLGGLVGGLVGKFLGWQGCIGLLAGALLYTAWELRRYTAVERRTLDELMRQSLKLDQMVQADIESLRRQGLWLGDRN